ncbi:10683_t:CDS:2, partial [Racocetra fulgida]
GRAITCIGELTDLSKDDLINLFKSVNLSESEVQKICKIVLDIPSVELNCRIDADNESLTPETEYTLLVSMERFKLRSDYDGRIYSPRFPKPQYESWWILLGDPNSDTIIDLKRINMRSGTFGTFMKKIQTKLKLVTPEREDLRSVDLHVGDLRPVDLRLGDL